MKYATHTNPLQVICHECRRDITLEAQYILDSKVYCAQCTEQEYDYIDDED